MPSDSEQTLFELTGLEADNLLAFLALLGTLRALEEVLPAARPRACWSLDNGKARPCLKFVTPMTTESLLEKIDEGILGAVSRFEFNGHRDPTVPPEDARTYLERARYLPCASIASAVMSDVAVNDKGDKVEATPLCTIFGQGHQHLLDRLLSVPRLSVPPKRGNGKAAVKVDAKASLKEALFQPWNRMDATLSFRWDTHEDVRWAYRYANPTDKSSKARTQHGANRLAAIALECLPAFPVHGKYNRVRVLARGARRAGGGGPRFRWPLWRIPASLSSLLAVLDSQPEADIPWIDTWVETQRFSQGKYMNWRLGEPLPVKDKSGWRK